MDADGDFVKSLIEQGSLARILQFDDPSAYMAEMLRGKQPITNLTNALKEAREYVDRLEELINCQVDIISTGPRRDQTIMPESVI